MLSNCLIYVEHYLTHLIFIYFKTHLLLVCVFLSVFCGAELVSPDWDHLRSGHLQLHRGGPPLPTGALQEAAQRAADAG